MSDSYFINFSYQSPHEDIENTTILKPDGSVNIFDCSDFITSLDPVGYNKVQANVDSRLHLDTLLETNIITASTIEENKDTPEDIKV
jgi:hypothetical protein